jgi:DNA gyrase subunit A
VTSDPGSGAAPAGEPAGSGGDGGGAIEPIEIQEEMERSFLEYAMSVIVSRALPDVRDGLKPVHRRILYGMLQQGLRPDRPYAKCARVVGDVMGKYHPHGDAAIYDALARMVQEFSLRHPLIDGHGSFGSPDPETGGPAAMRYTECRLNTLSLELMAGIDEDTVDFVANYDGNETEPVVLPARFPNLLVNGSQGIAVGMATNIPPHNLGEAIDATIHLIDHPDATPDDLMAFVKGPDFPTGALILGRSGILDAYRTGRGSIKLRAVAEIEEGRSGSQIIVTELPYQTSVEAIERRIFQLVEAKELDGIREVQNDSAGGRTRLVISLKRDANANVVLNRLFKLTPLQTSFGVNMLALVDGVPRTLNLARMLSAYVDHQLEVVTRRSQFRLDKAERRAHIVEGLLKALDMLDQVIELIRGSADRPAARAGLMAPPFQFSEVQAEHILDMTLGRLTRLGRSELEEEMARLRETISDLRDILARPERLRSVVKEELAELKAKHANPRRSQIVSEPGELNDEDLIEDEELIVTLSRAGYVKAQPASTFRTQARGGRGVVGTRLKDEDYVTTLLATSSHEHLLFFSNRGRVYRLRAYEVPVKERNARGVPIVNLLPLEPGERIQAVVGTREFGEDQHLLFATKLGQVKKTPMAEYDKSRRDGFIAINLRDGDELVRVVPTSGTDDVLIVTRRGMAIRFSEADVRPMGRDAAGVRGIRLREDDEVVACEVVSSERDLVLLTEAGYGKRTKTDHFNAQARGGQGVRAIRLTSRRGEVVGALMASLDDELMLVSSGGVTIRLPVREISAQGRDATGVRVMSLDEGQELAAAAPVYSDDERG